MKILAKKKTHVVRNGSSGARELPQFEQVFITRIIETGDIKTAIKRRIVADFFTQPDARAAYSYLVGFYNQYGETPSMELFRKKFPDFELQSTPDSVAAVADDLRQNKLYRDLVEMIDEGVALTREDVHSALSHFRTLVATLTTQHVLTRDMDITRTVEEMKAEYERVSVGQGMLGIPWPWPKLNETTLGIQNGELIFWYARPKAGKTWLMICTAVHALRNNRRVLFVTMEMPVEQIRRRTAAMWAGINYQSLRSGQLTASEKRRYFDDLEALAELEGFVVSGGDENRGTGITSLAAKIQEYSPDLVLVDGVYLMHDDRGNKKSSDWQSISHITQDLKSLVKRLNIPLIGSTQSNRAGEKTRGESLSEMAFSDSFVQDGDYVIRLIHDKEQKEDQEALVTLPGIREAPGCTFTINAKFAEDLSQKEVAESQEDIDEFLAGTDESTVVR